MTQASHSSTTQFFVRLAFLSILTALIFGCGSSSSSGDGKLYMRTMSWAGGTLDISWYYVTKDKIVVNPVGGANPVDMALEQERNARQVANYKSVGDGLLQLDWGDGRSQQVRVEYKDGGISAIDGGLMSPAKPFEGATLEDLTYTGLASTSQVTRTVTIFFGKDGQFRMNTIGSVTGGPGTVGVGVDEQARKGTYEIKENTLHFRYDDGTEWITAGQPYDLGNGELIIGDQLFKKSQ